MATPTVTPCPGSRAILATSDVRSIEGLPPPTRLGCGTSLPSATPRSGDSDPSNRTGDRPWCFLLSPASGVPGEAAGSLPGKPGPDRGGGNRKSETRRLHGKTDAHISLPGAQRSLSPLRGDQSPRPSKRIPKHSPSGGKEQLPEPQAFRGAPEDYGPASVGALTLDFQTPAPPARPVSSVGRPAWGSLLLLPGRQIQLIQQGFKLTSVHTPGQACPHVATPHPPTFSFSLGQTGCSCYSVCISVLTFRTCYCVKRHTPQNVPYGNKHTRITTWPTPRSTPMTLSVL